MVGPPSGRERVGQIRAGPQPAPGSRSTRDPVRGRTTGGRMFEPLGEDDSQQSGSKKRMRIIWIIVGVAVLVMLAVSFL